MSRRYPPLRLVSVPVATREQRDAARRRRGYWVRQARKLRGWTLKELAHTLGYEGDATGNLSKWESGERPIPSDMFGPLAVALGLPSDFLVKPPLTDEERLEEAMRNAADLEREDWEAGVDRYPSDADEPGGGLGRRSA